MGVALPSCGSVENPWSDLPREAPFIAPADGPAFDRHPAAGRDLLFDFLPSPYLGTPHAEVFVLMLNPGGRHDDLRSGPAFVEERRRAMRFESDWVVLAA